MKPIVPTSPNLDHLDVLTQAEFQEQQADNLIKQVFENEENAQRTGNLISDFVQSYERHKRDMPLDQWLISQFRLYPTIWTNDQELTRTAVAVIANVQANNESKASLYEHLEKGKSRESWLAKRLEEGASTTTNVNVATYATEIDSALAQANKAMASTITTNSGAINQSMNLDGFIAEQHHVDTFNLDAAAKGSGYTARVLNPEGTAYGKNSMDVGVYDENGALVKRYQAKYGQDAKSTEKLFDQGDYRGQRKLVPAEQKDQIANSTDVIEHDGIRSKPLTKAEAKALQEKAQLEAEAKQYDWNDANRIEIAKNIGKQALVGAALNAGMQATRIVGRRIWNWVIGKKNPPVSEDLQEFFESSMRSTTHIGAQVAVSGAMVVAAKSGWLGTLLKNTPAGRVVQMAYMALENAKILYKYGKGDITGAEALDGMGNTTSGMLGSLALASVGAAKGAALGFIFGPVGATVGGVIGGVVGGMAGSKVGQAIYEGGKTIVSTAVSTVKSVAASVGRAVTATVSAVSSFFGRLFS
jgi:hypothetical protein